MTNSSAQARRSLRPQYPPRARSGRGRLFRAAEWDRRPSDFRLCAQHLAALAEGGLGDALERAAVAGQGSCARHKLHQRRRHLRRRHEGRGRDVEQDFRLRAPARQHREPAVGLRAGLRHDALGDLALEHQHEPVVPGRPRLDGEPADQQRGRDVVGQVGDDARPGRRRDRARRRTSARRRR